MPRTLDDGLRTQKNLLHGGAALVWLFDFDRNGVDRLRVTPWPDPIVYRGETYSPRAIRLEDIPEDPGMLTEIRVVASDVTGVIRTMLSDGELLNRRGAVRAMVLTQAGTSAGAVTGHYFVQSAHATRDGVGLTLSRWMLSQVPAPRDRFIRTRCRWVFKSVQCGYVGVLTTCNKAFDDADGCLGRANQDRYGGFPYLLTGREALGLLGV